LPIQVQESSLHLLSVHTRMPFRYGIATMRAMPHAFLRLEVDVDGAVVPGVAADHLPPKWFTKDPDRPYRDDVDDMITVIEQAAANARELGNRSSVFDLWHDLYKAQRGWGRGQGFPPLLFGFGTSMVERALIDAFCRARQTSFDEAVRRGLLGIDLGRLQAELAGAPPARLLPKGPARGMYLRHTVGLSDPVRKEDVSAEEQLEDGLPQSLEAAIEAYELTHFKIKVAGEPEQDHERLARVAELLQGRRGIVVTLDGNEQFEAVEPVRAFWEKLREDPGLRPITDNIQFIEQPLHRSVALTDEIGIALREWKERPPILIDESDGELHGLPTALARGYDGTSHKNCKGVFKSIANACMVAHRRRQTPERSPILSGEDLTTIGPVSLMQDLNVAATLGLAHVERNGHQYFRGLSFFPEDLQEEVLSAHGDLYHRSDQGWPTLTITEGRISTDSVVRAPFGVGFSLDPSRFPLAADWSFDELQQT
jgi:hypothetical protein